MANDDGISPSSRQQYCLKWNNFSQHLQHAVHSTCNSGSRFSAETATAAAADLESAYSDVVLATTNGVQVRAHRIVLSACSQLFKQLLLDAAVTPTGSEALIVLHDVTETELRALVTFMYHGEVNVLQDTIPGLLRAAENLQIRGLCSSPSSSSSSSSLANTAASSAKDESGVVNEVSSGARGVTTGGSVKRAASHPPPGGGQQKRLRALAPAPPQPLLLLATLTASAQQQQQQHSQQQQQLHLAVDDVSDGETECSRLCIDEQSNGLEPETLLDEQEGECMSVCSNDTEQFCPLPRCPGPSPASFSALAELQRLSGRIKPKPTAANDLEVAILSSVPSCGAVRVFSESDVLSSITPVSSASAENGVSLPQLHCCRVCQCVCRDATSLRAHTVLLHTAGLDPFVCPCGVLFRTKYAVIVHKQRGHPPLSSSSSSSQTPE